MLKSRNLIIFIGVILTFLIILFFYPKTQSNDNVMSSEEVLQEISLSSQELEGFSVDKLFFDEQEKSTKAMLRSSKDILKIEAITDIDKRSADILLEDKIVTIHALYGNALSPYPGEISNKIICNEEYLPEFDTTQSKSLDYSYFILFANERFTYGACSEDLVKYKAILAWTFCEGKNIFYQFELFAPIETFSQSNIDLITSFKCLTN